MIGFKSHSVAAVEYDSWQNCSRLHFSDGCNSSLSGLPCINCICCSSWHAPSFCCLGLSDATLVSQSITVICSAKRNTFRRSWREAFKPPLTDIALGKNLSQEILTWAPVPCFESPFPFWKISLILKYYKLPLPLRPPRLWMNTETLQFSFALMF